MAAREPSMAVATASGPRGSSASACETASRAASPTPPLAATSADATRTSAILRYADRTRATFTLVLPISIPNQVGMPIALRFAHSMLK